MFGTVKPLVQFRSEATGRAAPSGHAVRTLAALVVVTVTLATTAVGGLASSIVGTPPTPATAIARPLPGPHCAKNPPVPYRLSRMREVGIGTKRLAVPAVVPSVK